MKFRVAYIHLLLALWIGGCQAQQLLGTLDTAGSDTDPTGDPNDTDAVSPEGCANSYQVIDLGTMGSRHSWARAINNQGQIAGHVADADGTTRAFLWSPTDESGTNGEMQDLTEGSSFLDALAENLNDAGEVVGRGRYFEELSGDETDPRAFFWNPSTGMVNIAPDFNATGVAVANGGLVAGNRWPDSAQFYGTGFTWNSWELSAVDTNGEIPPVLIDEKALLPGAQNWAGVSFQDLNDHGVAVGTGVDGQYLSRPFKWTQNGYTYLGTLSSTVDNASIPYAINNKGQIVGMSLVINEHHGDFEHPVLWQPYFDMGTPPVDLGILPYPTELNEGTALDINKHGHIVGFDTGTSASGTINRAWVYCGGNKYSLNDMLTATDDHSWLLAQAHGINDAGNIVGHGIFEGVSPRAFALIPNNAPI